MSPSFMKFSLALIAVLCDPIQVGRVDLHAVAPDERQLVREQRAIAAERAKVVLVGLDDEQVGAGGGVGRQRVGECGEK